MDNTEFTKRLEARFGSSTTEKTLIEFLQKEGFGIFRTEIGTNAATLKKDGFPCAYRWFVDWSVDTNGFVDSLRGGFGTVCL